jgi:signal transduction histidine kinase/CheY-like chemotaxis protein
MVRNPYDPATFRDGSVHVFDTFKGPLRDGRGNIYGVLSYSRDVTDQRAAAEQLRALNETLEQRVAARTAESEAARIEAERANRAKSEFLSRMSHELRTPMNAILGFAQVLELEIRSPEHQDFVQEILRAGSHLLQLINELLDLARIESGRLATSLEPVEVHAVFVEAQHLVRPLLEKNAVSLINKCDHRAVVLADSSRLRQVLVNLLSNAAKYNRQGGSVRIACTATPENRIRLSVTDTGPGIAANKLANLFTPFERLGAEFTEVEGTGIGLSISKRLVELMGGTLGVDSTPGQGSTFWVDLPLAPTVSRMDSMATSEPSAQASPLQRSKVLYVEDNAANLKVVEAIFRSQPEIALITATTGEYGLELARRYQPDVILLDIHLPGMSGFEVLKALQADETTSRIPVVALSADAMPIDIERGQAAGFRHYLTKPVRIGELTKTLTDLLKPAP